MATTPVAESMTATLTIAGAQVAGFPADAKTYSTTHADGSHKTGWYGQTKLVHEGKRYQVSVQVVEIAIKPAA